MKALDDLEAKAKAATPGPYKRTTSGDPHWLREVRDGDGEAVAWCGTFPEAKAHANAAYFEAASPDVVQKLIAAARAAQVLLWQCEYIGMTREEEPMMNALRAALGALE